MDLSSYGVRDDANIDRSTAGVTGNRRGAGSSDGASGCGCEWCDVDVLGRRVVGVDVADGEYGGPWGVMVEEDELVVDVILVLSSKAGVFFLLAILLCIGHASLPKKNKGACIYDKNAPTAYRLDRPSIPPLVPPATL